ncbi:MAG: T9SS type A sorting domain-containing protein, partial [Candidatus Symbiothrix sp.]|nr:T9SS type A sorting domain-containing protein [Candidatus Symbiothrix sp.]
WYFNKIPITQPSQDSGVTLTNITKEQAGEYYVLVLGEYSELSSDTISLVVVNSVENVKFAQIPTILGPNKTYTIVLGSETGAIEAQDITWSFSNNAVGLSPVLPEKTSATLTTTATEGNGLLRVSLANVCSSKVLEQQLTFSTIVSIGNVSADAIKIYPNPASDVLTIKSEAPINRIVITDINGRVVFIDKDSQSLGREREINISSLTKGVYVLKLATKDNETIHKVIKK